MTDYYVRKTGNDGNDGTNPTTQAWLTIDKAANTVAAADNVYVGAGVYRELVTMDTSGSSGSQISFIGDVDGEKTGDAGLVIISAYANETSTAARASCLDPDGRTFVTWRGFCMVGGTSAIVYSDNATNDDYEGCIYEDCVFVSGQNALDYSIWLDFNAATTPTNDGLIVRRCNFFGAGIRITWDSNETAEQDLKINVDSCNFIAGSSSTWAFGGIIWDEVDTGTYGSGGISVTNCAFIGHYYAAYVEHGTSTTYPVDIQNCYIKGVFGLYKATSNDGALTSDYNHFNCHTDYTSVTAGVNDKDDTDLGPQLLGGVGDLPLYRFWGWSPYRPWEPIRLQDDSYIHHVIGAADTSVAPAFDLYNEARPMHGTVDDIGAVEGRARAEQETSTVRTGSNAIVFEGAGYHDILLAVDASSTTVSVYGRYDATYGGTLPQLKVLNIPGVADQTDTMTGGSGSWEELTATFTPGSQGIARIRLVSSDTSAGGECFFDDLTIT
jgi:hypothetical protein